jgi:16S rRNA (guanine527-N7)-methyltransferase
VFHVKHSSYGSQDFARDLSVSRETLDRLGAYADLLRKWNEKTNLVSASTLPDLWRRHFLDSAQLARFAPDGGITDLGAGAGFPGLVLAILGIPDIHLVESDQKKVAFLREAARVSGAKVTIHPQRIETLPTIPTVHITSRALASVSEILALAMPKAPPNAKFLLLKGQNVAVELTEARKLWTMHVEEHASLSDPAARIVILGKVHRV